MTQNNKSLYDQIEALPYEHAQRIRLKAALLEMGEKRALRDIPVEKEEAGCWDSERLHKLNLLQSVCCLWAEHSPWMFTGGFLAYVCTNMSDVVPMFNGVDFFQDLGRGRSGVWWDPVIRELYESHCRGKGAFDRIAREHLDDYPIGRLLRLVHMLCYYRPGRSKPVYFGSPRVTPGTDEMVDHFGDWHDIYIRTIAARIINPLATYQDFEKWARKLWDRRQHDLVMREFARFDFSRVYDLNEMRANLFAPPPKRLVFVSERDNIPQRMSEVGTRVVRFSGSDRYDDFKAKVADAVADLPEGHLEEAMWLVGASGFEHVTFDWRPNINDGSNVAQWQLVLDVITKVDPCVKGASSGLQFLKHDCSDWLDEHPRLRTLFSLVRF